MDLPPHPLTLRQLQYAVAVADALSFRRAAEHCYVSQPSLSAQLADLEAALGVQLFERDRRRVLLTPAGHALLERARRVLLEADDLVAAARRAGDPLAGTLRVGVIPTIAPYLLPMATARIRRAFARLTIAWVEDKTEALVRSLDTGALDGVLLALEADIGDVEHERIAEDPFVLVAPRKHPLVMKDAPAAIRELRGTGVLLLDEGHCFREQALELCSTVRARELEFRATSLATLVQMVVQGAGVTLLPVLAVDAETRRAELAIRPFERPAPHRTLAMVWRRRSPLGPALRQVAAVIRDAYADAVPEPGVATPSGVKRARIRASPRKMSKPTSPRTAPSRKVRKVRKVRKAQGSRSRSRGPSSG